MGLHSYEDDEAPEGNKKKKFQEFDCPSCNANNPWPDGFVDREEVHCHYCGTSYEVRISEEGRVKLKET